MSFSILHISDLHRDMNDEMANEWLIASLARDFDNFSKQDVPILKPSLCVVSGDLIYGVSPSCENSEFEIRRQYQQAKDFLIRLAEKFFDGDRNKIIIVPGNHDVSFPVMLESVEMMDLRKDKAERQGLVARFFKKNSSLRWSWSDLRFYEIVDKEKYLNRFIYFSEMYNDFYQGIRSYSLLPEEQFHIFDFPDISFCILALNSCFDNDPFNRGGSFSPIAFTRACQLLADPKRYGWLVASTWHHNLAGTPTTHDHLDAEFLQLLIDAGVSIAFHGHQHLPECFDERFRFGLSLRKMTIISAGTLCADAHHLQPGVPRSYNVVELDASVYKGKVHQRKMVNITLQNLPIWGPGQFPETNLSYVDFELCRPLNTRSQNLDLQISLEEVENLLGQCKWSEVVDFIMRFNLGDSARPFLVKALDELDDAEKIIKLLWPPASNQEIVIIGNALISKGSIVECKEFLELDVVKLNEDASVREVKIRIETRKLK